MTLRKFSLLINHLGLIVAVAALTLGGIFSRNERIRVYEGYPEQAGDLSIELHSFSLESYDNGMPRHFASDITAKTADGRCISGTVEVNHPLRAGDWLIYQYGYDQAKGDGSAYSEFLLVSDPWEAFEYAGIFLLLAGAVCLILMMPIVSDKRLKIRAIVISILLAAVFLAITLMGTGLRLRSLPPALQSAWFAPHIVVYMFSYACLAASTVMGVIIIIRKNVPDKTIILTDSLVYAGTSLFTIGMLFGALWAKQAWGAFWTWDPKETCAAITWVIYLVYLHFRKARPAKIRASAVILFLAFISLQICWWGINLIPAARALSMHTY